MIVAWMLYAIVASILLGLAAFALERIAMGTRRQMRFLWAASMIASAAWPTGMFAAHQASRIAPAFAPAALTQSVNVVSSTVGRMSRSALDVSIDTILVALWAALTLAFAARVVHALLHTRRRAHHWTVTQVNGVAVHTSPDVGPAVVGFSRMRVVVPEWILSLDAELRDLVLVHEEQHRMARDPYLLLFATVLVGLMPWNVALVWQARRLRLAIELDCDARVLRAHPNPERYARLLLAVAQRSANMPSLLASTMSEPAKNLSRRISAMRPQSLSRIRVGALLASGVVAIVAACTMDAPSTPEMPAGGITYDSVSRLYVRRPLDSATESKVERAMNVIRETGNYDSANRIVLDRDSTATLRAVLRELKHKGVDTIGNLIVEQGTVSGSKLVKDRIPQVAPSVLQEVQAEHAARPLPGTMVPEYPPMLKAANVSGEVVMSVVVNENGKPDMSTFRVIRSSHPLFTDAVRAAVKRSTWTPASVAGRNVRQVAELPFTFEIK